MDVVVGGGIKDFFAMIGAIGGGCVAIGKALGQKLDVPYMEEREGEKLLGCKLKEGHEGELFPTHRYRFPSGEILCTNEWPERLVKEKAEQLTEEVWTKDNWHNSFNDVEGAVQKLPNGIVGVYFHRPSMNLVLVAPGGEKVGIRSTALRKPFRDAGYEACEPLGRLTKATVS